MLSTTSSHLLRTPIKRWAWLIVCLACGSAPAQWAQLDRLDQGLSLQSSNGWFSTKLSGLLDAEEYFIDQRPPGLIYNHGPFFFNPRLSLFLDTRFGPHFYSMVQARFDRGFDPGAKSSDGRLDEYLLRWTPLADARLNLQVGKFATVFGNWVPRHLSWDNPFINAPLPYEFVTAVLDEGVLPTGVFKFIHTKPDNKYTWLPQIWGPSYATGASIFGAINRFDYALEIKNASLSSPPYAWDLTAQDFSYPTYTGRVGYRPNEQWNVGSSFSYGPYFLQETLDSGVKFPPGKSLGDYNQTTVGSDVSFAWHHWQLWDEALASRFEIPNTGNADMLSYYLEAKYKISTHLYAAARWNQQFYHPLIDSPTGPARWEYDNWRVDLALGWRFNRHLQSKVQYSFSRQDAPFQQGEQLVAAQVTLKF